ncbi:MAG: hypothetical protein AAGE01_19525 [Pseudomonadota bacterium]
MSERRPAPLTHHDILRLGAPVVRRGWRVDLAESDRTAGSIAFLPSEPDPALKVGLRVDFHGRSGPKLVRTAAHADGAVAAYLVERGSLEAMLEALGSLPAAAQFRSTDQGVIADDFSLRLDREASPRLIGCCGRIGGLVLSLDAKTIMGEPMTLHIRPVDPERKPSLPDDLLAVLGPRWRPLIDHRGGWNCELKAPGKDPRRSIVARERFAQAMTHVDAVLASPPPRFHGAFLGARWRSFVRRSSIIWVPLLIVGSLPLIDWLFLTERQLHPLFQMSPPIIFAFLMLIWWRDMPRFEVPPLPRPVPDDAWQPGEP